MEFVVCSAAGMEQLDIPTHFSQLHEIRDFSKPFLLQMMLQTVSFQERDQKLIRQRIRPFR